MQPSNKKDGRKTHLAVYRTNFCSQIDCSLYWWQMASKWSTDEKEKLILSVSEFPALFNKADVH